MKLCLDENHQEGDETLMPHQWMENEWIAQVPFQEEETEWSSSPRHQKLYPRPRFLSRRTKQIIFGSLTVLCMTVLWGIALGGQFLEAITNEGVTIVILSLDFWLLCFFGCVWLGECESNKRHSEHLHSLEKHIGQRATADN